LALRWPIGREWYATSVMAEPADPLVRNGIRYVREPTPLNFPEAAQVPESPVHLRVRTALFLLLEFNLRGRAYVGSDQFVYWDPTDPKACLAPDALVRLGGPSNLPRTYLTWELGAPHLAVEVLSRSDERDADLDAKLARYRRSGIAEVVFFDPEGERPLRIWDRGEWDLTERDLFAPDGRRSRTLDAFFQLEPHPELGRLLRLSDDADGTLLWLGPTEAERAAKEAERAAKEAALARVAELEAELARRPR
jgi:Uma2 family endonuclease